MDRIARIKGLLNYLPTKDIVIGNKLLSERNFDSLQELIDSAIIKIKKYRQDGSLVTKKGYENISLKELGELKSEVDTYTMCLNISDSVNEEDVFDNFDNLNNEENL